MVVWIAFTILIFLLLALDLGVLNRKAHTPSTAEAMGWTALWVSTALLFAFVVHYLYRNGLVGNIEGLTPGQAVTKYLTGYLVEQSLSMDNIFVMALIFNYFHIPQKYQHRVLFWGIIGAIFFRGVMIGIGAVLIHQYYWVIYIFAAILLWSAWKMLKAGDEVKSLENNSTIRFVRKFMPVIRHMGEGNFVIRRLGVRAVTPLFLALAVVETTDIMFAFDSIPAIFGITTDPFIVFTSNIFAILGLRSLYFVLVSLLNKFRYLKPTLVFILFFVGVKMLISHHVEMPEWLSLSVIAGSLAFGIGFSFWKASREKEVPAPTE
jgi:tellurite resistance protein TerC